MSGGGGSVGIERSFFLLLSLLSICGDCDVEGVGVGCGCRDDASFYSHTTLISLLYLLLAQQHYVSLWSWIRFSIVDSLISLLLAV